MVPYTPKLSAVVLPLIQAHSFVCAFAAEHVRPAARARKSTLAMHMAKRDPPDCLNEWFRIEEQQEAEEECIGLQGPG